MSKKKATNPWRPIKTAPEEVSRWSPVDLWMTVHASPLSFGIGDAFRITDCWKDDEGKWTHNYKGEPAQLEQRYITHWTPILTPHE